MVGSGRLRCKQEKNQIHRALVYSVEIDGMFKAREQAIQSIDCGQLAMRDRNSVADTRRSEPFPLNQNVKNSAFVLAGCLGRTTRKFLKRLLFARRPQVRVHPVRPQ